MGKRGSSGRSEGFQDTAGLPIPERRKRPRFNSKIPITFRVGRIEDIGTIGNFFLGGFLFQAVLSEEQIREIRETKATGEVLISVVADLMGKSIKLKGRATWFDLGFDGPSIKLKAGVELINPHSRWIIFVEQLQASSGHPQQW